MAVYTQVSPENLNSFLERYDLGAARTFKGIAEGVENSNYLLGTKAGNFILTLYEKRVEAADLPYFLDLMDFLAARGAPCPVPVRDRSGASAQELCGRPAAIVSFLEGVPVNIPGPDHCAEVGRAAANLHLFGGDFPARRDNDLSLAGWRRLHEACADRADEVMPGLATLLAEELEILEKAWPEALPEGVIHADLFPDNVFFLDGSLSGVIDFYFACNDYLAYEMGVCINAWCFSADASFEIENARAMLSAYQDARPLSDAEKRALPILARGASVRFLLTRLYDWLNQVDGALVKCKDPLDYVKRLEFHRRAGGAGDYGIE